MCGRTVDYVAISGGQNGCIKVALNLNDGSGNPVAPGTYYLTVTDTENVKIAPEEITVEVIDGIPPQTPQKDIYVYNTDVIPAVAAGGRKWSDKQQQGAASAHRSLILQTRDQLDSEILRDL